MKKSLKLLESGRETTLPPGGTLHDSTGAHCVTHNVALDAFKYAIHVSDGLTTYLPSKRTTAQDSVDNTSGSYHVNRGSTSTTVLLVVHPRGCWWCQYSYC